MKHRKIILGLVLTTLLGVSPTLYANNPTMLLELDEVTDQLYLGDLHPADDYSPLRRGRVSRVSHYFDNHFIYQEEGFISIPPNSEIAALPEHPRRKLEKKHSIGHTEKFSAQVKLSILGADITAGPTLSFSRNYSVSTSIVATSTKGLLLLDQNTGALKLDFSKKLRVSCSISASASSDLSGSAGVKLFGVGSDVSGDTTNSISVTQESTPFYLPEINNHGDQTSYKNVTDWCEHVFYKLNKDSVDRELSLIASQLIYKNERNECENDMDCMDWFEGLRDQAESSFSIVSREILTANPRCVSKENERHPYNKCVVRKTLGQNCEPRSAAWQVNHCDKGLSCTVVKKGGLFTSQITRCQK